MTVVFRDFTPDDLLPVARLAEDIWIRPEYGPRHSREISILYVYNCLAKQTSTLVAVEEGQVVGIVSVRDRSKHATRAVGRKDVRPYMKEMLQMDEAEQLIQLTKIYDSLNRKMLKECGLRKNDQLTLLMLDSRMRGRGIGKKLFQKGIEQLSGKGDRTMFVLTDDESNYVFYEKMGCEQVDHRTMDYAGTPLKMFVYRYRY